MNKPMIPVHTRGAGSARLNQRTTNRLIRGAWLGRAVRGVLTLLVAGLVPAVAWAGASVSLTRLIPSPTTPPAQPALSLSLIGDEQTDANGNTERDWMEHYNVNAIGYSNWNYYIYTEQYSGNWWDPRGALGAGTYDFVVTVHGYHKEPYNYGWVDGHWEDTDCHDVDDYDEYGNYTGTHTECDSSQWVDGGYDAGFNWNWQQLGSASISFTLASSVGQTISFNNPGTRAYADVFNPGATASSGLPVTYTIVSGPATTNGSTVTVTGVGTVVIQASQAGGYNAGNGTFYAAASSVQQTISTTKLNQTITFPTPSTRGYGTHTPASLGIVMSANALAPVLVVNSGPATVVNGLLSINGTSGTVTLTVSQPGGTNHNAATPVTQTFSIGKGSQTLSPPVTSNRSVSDAAFSAAATISSGLPITYAIVSGPGAIHPTSGLLTLTGTAGTVTVRASQAGDANWNAATPVTYSYAVTAPANWVTMTIPAQGPFNYTTSAIPLQPINVSMSRLPIGTITASLQTPTGTIISGPVTVTPASPTTPVSYQGGGGGNNGVNATYFNDMSLGAVGFSTTDWNIDYDWGGGGPGVGEHWEEAGHEEEEHDNPDDPDEVTGSHWVDGSDGWDRFSVRWTGYVRAPTTENYTFITTTDDGARLFVNGNLVVSDWTWHGMSDHYSQPIPLTQGESYAITMEFFEDGGDAGARLSWQSPSRGREVIPHSSLYTSQPTTTINSSYNWTVSGLTIPAGQAANSGYRLVLNYTPFDAQTVASVAVALFDISAIPPPTLAILSGDQQTGVISQFNQQPFDIAIYDGTTPRVNTTVTLAVQSGGGQLATSNATGATLQSTLNLQTDSVGTVQAYYKQPASSGISSQVLVTSGGAQKTIVTFSSVSVNSPASVWNSGTGNSVTFSWSVPNSGGPAVTGYHVYKNGVKVTASPTAGTSYTDNAVIAGNSYGYSVRAVDAAGNLSAPTSMIVTVGSTEVTLRLPPTSTNFKVNTGTWTPTP